MPLLSAAIAPVSKARRERQGCKPEQSSSMFYCTPAVNGARETQERAPWVKTLVDRTLGEGVGR